MSISPQETLNSVRPLRFIFWGGLICIFDVSIGQTINGRGWTFDVINDFVGMLMITWGVCRLGEIQVHDRYRKAMLFVKLISILSCFDAIHSHLIYDVPVFLSFVFSLLGALMMAAAVIFCLAMRWLCREAGLAKSEQSWRTTTLLFVLIYLIPLGLFYGAAAIAIATGTSFNIDLGPAGLLLLPVFCIPLIHFFISTSRMGRDARGG